MRHSRVGTLATCDVCHANVEVPWKGNDQLPSDRDEAKAKLVHEDTCPLALLGVLGDAVG